MLIQFAIRITPTPFSPIPTPVEQLPALSHYSRLGSWLICLCNQQVILNWNTLPALASLQISLQIVCNEENMFNSSGGMKLKFQPPPGEWIKCGLTNYPLVPRWSNVSCPAGNTRPQQQILNPPHTQAYITPSGWQQDWTRLIKRRKYEIFCTQACFANHLWHQDCRNFEAIFQIESSFFFLIAYLERKLLLFDKGLVYKWG